MSFVLKTDINDVRHLYKDICLLAVLTLNNRDEIYAFGSIETTELKLESFFDSTLHLKLDPLDNWYFEREVREFGWDKEFNNFAFYELNSSDKAVVEMWLSKSRLFNLDEITEQLKKELE